MLFIGWRVDEYNHYVCKYDCTPSRTASMTVLIVITYFVFTLYVVYLLIEVVGIIQNLSEFMTILSDSTFIAVVAMGFVSALYTSLLRLLQAEGVYSIHVGLTYSRPIDYFLDFIIINLLLGCGVIFPFILNNMAVAFPNEFPWDGLIVNLLLANAVTIIYMLWSMCKERTIGLKVICFIIGFIGVVLTTMSVLHYTLGEDISNHPILENILFIATIIHAFFIFIFAVMYTIIKAFRGKWITKTQTALITYIKNIDGDDIPHLITMRSTESTWIIMPCQPIPNENQVIDNKENNLLIFTLAFDPSRYLVRSLEGLQVEEIVCDKLIQKKVKYQQSIERNK